jgi:hypothetical protein
MVSQIKRPSKIPYQENPMDFGLKESGEEQDIGEGVL